MPDNDEITNGELSRGIDLIRADIRLQGQRFEAEVAKVETRVMARVVALEDWQKWAIRVVLGALMVAGVGAGVAIA